MPSNPLDLEYIFHPKSIALVGISTSPTNSMRGIFLDPLLEFGFEGNIYLVNPRGGELFGFPVYPSVKDIPAPVDYVITSIPAHRTPQLMEDCITKGVKVVSMFTAGFSETGNEEGARLEAELVRIARTGGVRLLGPNCMGIYCPSTRLSFDPGFPKQAGSVAFISQSGGNSWMVVRMGSVRGVRFSKVISFGNGSDIDSIELLDYLARDPETEVIAAYMEGVKDGRRLIEVLKRISSEKPVIILKGGRTEAGNRAVASHTGALAGADAIWDAVFRQGGAIRVENMDEMVDLLVTFSFMSRPGGRNVGVVGVGGGQGIQSADDLETMGFSVPPLPHNIQEELKSFGPPAGYSVANPVDSLTVMNPEDYARTVRLLSNWSGIDLMITYIVVDLFPYEFARTDLSNMMADPLVEGGKASARPMAVVLDTGVKAEASEQALKAQKRLYSAGLPVYPSMPRAARAIRKYIDYHERRRINS